MAIGRSQTPVNNGQFHVSISVGNDGEAGQFACCTSRGVDRKKRRNRLGELVQPFVIADIATIGNHRGDAFGRIVGAAAAEGDDAVGLYVLVDLYAIENVLVGRVRLGAVKNGSLQPGLLPTGP